MLASRALSPASGVAVKAAVRAPDRAAASPVSRSSGARVPEARSDEDIGPVAATSSASSLPAPTRLTSASQGASSLGKVS